MSRAQNLKTGSCCTAYAQLKSELDNKEVCKGLLRVYFWLLKGIQLTLAALFAPRQIKVEFSMKFTSRDLSLKRTPSKKQSGVFGVKINVVTKCVWLLSLLT